MSPTLSNTVTQEHGSVDLQQHELWTCILAQKAWENTTEILTDMGLPPIPNKIYDVAIVIQEWDRTSIHSTNYCNVIILTLWTLLMGSIPRKSKDHKRNTK